MDANVVTTKCHMTTFAYVLHVLVLVQVSLARKKFYKIVSQMQAGE
jgi:hypothetical protein